MAKSLMSDVAQPRAAASTAASDDRSTLSNDLIWEVASIAAEIGRTHRQTLYLLENGLLPASKVGSRWCSSRVALRSFFASQISAKAVA